MFSLSLAFHQLYSWKLLNSKIKTQEGSQISLFILQQLILWRLCFWSELCISHVSAKTDLSVQKWCLARCHPLPVCNHRKHYSTKLRLPRAKMSLKTGLLQASKCNPKFSAGPCPLCSNLSSCKDITKVVGLLSWAVLPFPCQDQPQHPPPPQTLLPPPRAKPAAAAVQATQPLLEHFGYSKCFSPWNRHSSPLL